MGTRHLICIVHEGKFKLAQYGQWDGYPEGQGKKIVGFLLNKDPKTGYVREKLIAGLARLRDGTEEEIKATWVACGADPNSDLVTLDVARKHSDKYPLLSRDTGADCLHIISHHLSDEGALVFNQREFAADSLFCEWAYVLDLDNEVLEVYQGFNKDEHADRGRFADLPLDTTPHASGKRYYPVRLLKKYKFSELRVDTMDALNAELRDDEE